MIRNTKKAFTLVELIVVITILAILGTIAFISLQGYSGEARDSKRLSNVNDLIKKVNIEVTKGASLGSMLAAGSAPHTGLINNTGATINQGTLNFVVIREEATNFQDLNNKAYPMAVAEGGTGSGAYKFMQMATINETENRAVVVGNYYKMNSANDVGGLIINSSSGVVVDGEEVLPYTIN